MNFIRPEKKNYNEIFLGLLNKVIIFFEMEYKIDCEKPSYQEFDQERQFEERGERENL